MSQGTWRHLIGKPPNTTDFVPTSSPKKLERPPLLRPRLTPSSRQKYIGTRPTSQTRKARKGPLFDFCYGISGNLESNIILISNTYLRATSSIFGLFTIFFLFSFVVYLLYIIIIITIFIPISYFLPSPNNEHYNITSKAASDRLSVARHCVEVSTVEGCHLSRLVGHQGRSGSLKTKSQLSTALLLLLLLSTAHGLFSHGPYL